jgi:hypothetical protein
MRVAYPYRARAGASNARLPSPSENATEPENALGYLVDEKLMNFAGAAEQRPEFAAELPAFVAEVRKLFTPQELRDHFAELERTPLFETEPEDGEEFEDDPLDNPAQEVEQRQRLAWVKAMLLQFGS